MTNYEVRIPAVAMRFEAKDKKDALKKARQNLKEIADVLLKKPEFWREV